MHHINLDLFKYRWDYQRSQAFEYFPIPYARAPIRMEWSWIQTMSLPLQIYEMVSQARQKVGLITNLVANVDFTFANDDP